MKRPQFALLLASTAIALAVLGSVSAQSTPGSSGGTSDTVASRGEQAAAALQDLKARREAGAWSEAAEAEYLAAKATVQALKEAREASDPGRVKRAFRSLMRSLQTIGALLERDELSASPLSDEKKTALLRNQAKRMRGHLAKLKARATTHGISIDTDGVKARTADVQAALRGGDSVEALASAVDGLRIEISKVQEKLLNDVQAQEVSQ